MTALSDDRSLDQVNAGSLSMLQLGVAGGETLYMGSAAAAEADGMLVAAGSTAGTGYVLGIASHRADNSSGSDGAISCNLAQGLFRRVNSSTSALTQAMAPCLCYAEDDQTARVAGGATYPLLGLFVGFEDDGTTPLVFVSATANQGYAAGGAAAAPAQAQSDLIARYVMTTNVASLAAFTVAQDGVTGVEGDVVLLAGQTTKSQNGLYIVGVVAAGAAPLTRAESMPTGTNLPAGTEVQVDAGTVFADTTWFLTTAGGAAVVGTTNHDWYPRCVSQTAALTAGTVTVSNVPILSATKSAVVLTRHTANTCVATDGGYHATVAGANGITPGVVGTAACVIQATVLAGTINNADVSTLHITIIN